MNPLLIVGCAVFLCAVLTVLLLFTSFLAVLIFRLAPPLRGTVLSLTPSDIVRIVREMPTYPVWWPHGGVPGPNQKLVLIAVNPLTKAEYLRGFDPSHVPLFTPNRNEGRQFDFEDLFVLKKLCGRLDEEGLYAFLVPVDLSTFRAAGRIWRRQRGVSSLPTPPRDMRIRGPKLPKRAKPVTSFHDRVKKAS